MAKKSGISKYGLTRSYEDKVEPENEPTSTPASEQAPAESSATATPVTQAEKPGEVAEADWLTPVAAEPEKKKEEKVDEWSPVFGWRRNKKDIAVLASIGFVLVGLIYFLIAKDDFLAAQPDHQPQMIPLIFATVFMAIHGGLAGMLLGQLIYVYPQVVMIVFTVMTILIGEGACAALGAYDPSQTPTGPVPKAPREILQMVVAMMFWAGFVGFWMGYIFYARHENKRKRFQERVKQQGLDNL